MIDSERFRQIRSMLRRRQPDLTVVMDNVNKPHNLSALIRSCDAVGIHDLHAVSKQRSIHTRQHAAAGSSRWTRLHLWHEIKEPCSALRREGMQLLAATNVAAAVDFREIDYTLPTAVILGAEWDGVSKEAIGEADRTIMVQTHGMVESLNVSVAAAVILFEAERQRSLNGMYRELRMEEEQYRRLLFELSYPRLAEQLTLKKLPYPALDEDGGIFPLEM
ncbi:tRNA (guanosine(18)-2'-O)-methyltransferase TrmH [Pelodictyon luteolum]|uniref:tRNA (guanosine(18)-2'-O)-methyltransferase n=1 Tax=Chlorobium luteolum (strain DSM 273 / BCRC 81028 / 2530) TaxID=319225 RepID=Q3B3G4_CHLL3|nr:tRNA (guanosine(18)-2'-O)-methyltransferase TrmH [Pelodictyon luteolum]ABB24117.1 tRNA (guanosine-2'-O-)-methyltransferase [Pelodictyon luteolum DSM 273]